MEWVIGLFVIGWLASIFCEDKNSNTLKKRKEDSESAFKARLRRQEEIRKLEDSLKLEAHRKTSTNRECTSNALTETPAPKKNIETLEDLRDSSSEEKASIDESNNKSIGSEFSKYGTKSLWHMTHRDNLAGILNHGILSHYQSKQASPSRVDISNHSVQQRRSGVDPHYGRRVHDYAPLYINPKNPMLYYHKDRQAEICLVEVSLDCLSENNFIFTDGNAASQSTLFFGSLDYLNSIPWEVINARYWTDHPDGKRKRCSEVMVYPKIESKHIISVVCCSSETYNMIRSLTKKARISTDNYFMGK